MRTPILRLRARLGTIPTNYLASWMDKLTPPQRAAVRLQLQGLSIAAIARQLHISVAAVRSRLQKARLLLNTLYDHRGDPK